MEKAQTLPRTKRDKSPSPSSTSFSSLNKLGKGLKLRKKKKKYEVTSGPPEETKSKLQDDAADDEVEETTLQSKSHPSITFTKADSASFLENERNASEVPRSPKISPRNSTKGHSKTPIKKIVKGGKSMLQKLKGKNESAPVMVEVAPLDLGRTPAKKQEEFGPDEADTSTIADDTSSSVREEVVGHDETGENDVEAVPPLPVTVTVEADEWSVTETCEKVRRRSKLDNQVSVYEEEEEEEEEQQRRREQNELLHAQEVGSENDSAFDPASPEPRITDQEMKLSVSQTSISNGDQSQINFNKKSPSTIKKEILLSISSAKSRKTSDPTNGGPKNDAYRKTSVQVGLDRVICLRIYGNVTTRVYAYRGYDTWKRNFDFVFEFYGLRLVDFDMRLVFLSHLVIGPIFEDPQRGRIIICDKKSYRISKSTDLSS